MTTSTTIPTDNHYLLDERTGKCYWVVTGTTRIPEYRENARNDRWIDALAGRYEIRFTTIEGVTCPMDDAYWAMVNVDRAIHRLGGYDSEFPGDDAWCTIQTHAYEVRRDLVHYATHGCAYCGEDITRSDPQTGRGLCYSCYRDESN